MICITAVEKKQMSRRNVSIRVLVFVAFLSVTFFLGN